MLLEPCYYYAHTCPSASFVGSEDSGAHQENVSPEGATEPKNDLYLLFVSESTVIHGVKRLKRAILFICECLFLSLLSNDQLKNPSGGLCKLCFVRMLEQCFYTLEQWFVDGEEGG